MFDERRRLSSREKKNRSVSLSLSPLLFFFWLLLFLALLSLSRSLSLSSGGVSRFPLSRNSDESARGFQRAPLCCSETRACTREKREREKETRERARAQTNTLYRRKFLSFALSLRRYREELHHTDGIFRSLVDGGTQKTHTCFPWETIIMKTKRRRKNHRRR